MDSGKTKLDQLRGQLEAVWGDRDSDGRVMLETVNHLIRDIKMDVAYRTDCREELISTVILAYVLMRLGKTEEAKELAANIPAKFEEQGDFVWLARAVGVLGKIHLWLGNRMLAVSFLQKQYRLGIELNDVGQCQAALHNLHWLHMEKKDYEKAAVYMESALRFTTGNEPAWNQFITLSNLAECYIRLDRLSEAEELLGKSLAISVDHDHQLAQSIGLQRYGMYFEAKGDHKEALSYYGCSLDIVRPVDSPLTETITRLQIGRLQLEGGSLEKAEKTLFEIVKLCHEGGFKRYEFEAYALLADLYEKQGAYQKALRYQKQFYELKELVFAEDSEQEIRQLEIFYETELAQQTAEKLRDQNEVLENEVDRRTRQLEGLLAQETAVSDLKSHIITTVSHEFRTPLTVINNSAEMLYRYSAKLTAEKKGQVYGRIRESIFYLSQLLDSMSTVDKVQSGKISPSLHLIPTVELFAMVRSFLPTRFASADNIQLETVSDLDHQLLADQFLLLEIIYQLVDNAVKFSDKTEIVTVRFSTQGNETLLIQVEDYGIGVLPQEIPHLFHLFFRGENGLHKQGLGIGLYIAKLFSQMIGATLTIRPLSAEAGTAVSLTLPLYLF